METKEKTTSDSGTGRFQNCLLVHCRVNVFVIQSGNSLTVFNKMPINRDQFLSSGYHSENRTDAARIPPFLSILFWICFVSRGISSYEC